MLPTYQAEHRLYDRFLPYMAQRLEPGALVIDIGANCGDTLASMFDCNAALHYVCIEPDSRFFALLEENRRRIVNAHPTAKISLIQSLVGLNVKKARLSGTGGTKSAKPLERQQDALQSNESVYESVTLKSLLDGDPEIDATRIRLLKSDVDGYDYDVIDSAALLIDNYAPILFFECQYADDAQKAGFAATLDSLANKGYTLFWLFDNFGNPLVGTGELEIVRQVIDYVWRENRARATRTFYYVDILCCHSRDVAFVSRVVDDFVATVVES